MKTRRNNVFLMAAFACIAVTVFVTRAGGVEPGQTSYTAEVVCAFRSIGATDPDPKTRNPDDMARHFVNPALKGRIPGVGLAFEDAKVAMDLMKNGVFYYVNARTHHIDSLLSQSLQEGTQQVVIFGAGFDSRAYRFHDRYPTVRFFEIDLPATSAAKQQRVDTLLGAHPAWVTFVPLDFNTQTLDEVLARAGFENNQKTFYVWEGVTYFISGAAVDSTLRFVANRSAPGSQIVFDYMLEDVVMGCDYSPYGARTTVFGVSLYGEPYIFGIAPPTIEAFVNLRQLALVSDLGPMELTQRYLIRTDGTVNGKIAEFLRIAHATVPTTAESDRLYRRAKKHLSPSDSGPQCNPVTIPEDVQTFLRRYSQDLMKKDLEALMTHFTDKFLNNGYTKPDIYSFLYRGIQRQTFHRHEITLTRFGREGDIVNIDGYVSRQGYRIPLMITGIIREADGKWRWYGNQR
jgi:methyltransferase (TIGR00027 family)